MTPRRAGNVAHKSCQDTSTYRKQILNSEAFFLFEDSKWVNAWQAKRMLQLLLGRELWYQHHGRVSGTLVDFKLRKEMFLGNTQDVK